MKKALALFFFTVGCINAYALDCSECTQERVLKSGTWITVSSFTTSHVICDGDPRYGCNNPHNQTDRYTYSSGNICENARYNMGCQSSGNTPPNSTDH